MNIKKRHYKVIVFERLHSTQAWAKINVDSFDRSVCTVVVARNQPDGYGKQQARWFFWPGNIAVSLCLFSDRVLQRELPLFVAGSVVKALEPISLQIKYPNDIIAEGKKLAGILVDVDYNANSIIAGVGLNVNATQKELASVDQPATSLLCMTGRYFDVDAVIENIVRQFIFDFQVLEEKGSDALWDYIKSRQTLNHPR